MHHPSNHSITIIETLPTNQNNNQSSPNLSIEIDKSQANQHYHDLMLLYGMLVWTIKNAINKTQIERLFLDQLMANYVLDNKILTDIDQSIKYITAKIIESQTTNSTKVKICTGLYKTFNGLKYKLSHSVFWNNNNNYSGFPENFYDLLNIPLPTQTQSC